MLNARLSGAVKEDYLLKLDLCLGILQNYFGDISEEQRFKKVLEYGMSKNWDWSRLPLPRNTTSQITDYLSMVRSMYKLLRRIDNQANPLDNMGLFKEIGLSRESGLPWYFDFVRLQELKSGVSKELSQQPSYQEIATKIKHAFMTDYVDEADLSESVAKLRESALNRNYLERLADTELLSWKSNQYSTPIAAKKLIRAGVEEFWNVSFLRYQNSSSLYEIYVLDAWQDDQEKIFDETEQGTKIHPEIMNFFQFHRDNGCGYILGSLDEKFPSLHPVHLSRILIGPYEHVYRTDKRTIPPLNSIQEIISSDPEQAFLRASWIYSFAPNSQDKNGTLRQIITPDDWKEEIIISPTKYASALSQSLLGTNIKIIEVKNE